MHRACALDTNVGGCAAQVLPTQLIPDEKEGKVLRVRMIQKEGVKFFNPAYLFDEGSTISWIPCGRKLTCSFPGIKFYYGPDTYFGEEVRFACLPASGTTSRAVKLQGTQLTHGANVTPFHARAGFVAVTGVTDASSIQMQRLCCLPFEFLMA